MLTIKTPREHSGKAENLRKISDDLRSALGDFVDKATGGSDGALGALDDGVEWDERFLLVLIQEVLVEN